MPIKEVGKAVDEILLIVQIFGYIGVCVGLFVIIEYLVSY
jgi:hypothetical protein